LIWREYFRQLLPRTEKEVHTRCRALEKEVQLGFEAVFIIVVHMYGYYRLDGITVNNGSLASTAVLRRTGPVFSTMTSVVAPCLSALLLPPLLLLLLASSAYEQVRVVCSLSGAAAVARRRAAVTKAVKNALWHLWVWAPRAQPLAGGVSSPLLRQLQQCSVWRYL
jgi:hypothetical protein